MKHLVATSIAAHSVPCFPPQPLLFSISQGLYTRKTWSTERPVMTNILHFCNHCPDLPNVAPLRLLIQKIL